MVRNILSLCVAKMIGRTMYTNDYRGLYIDRDIKKKQIEDQV